jgi:hypothetical protein
LGLIIFFKVIKPTKTAKVLRDFAVTDTASVDKVFLADMNNNQVLLERIGDSWMANKKYKARTDFMNVLLETIKRVEIKSPVSEKKYPQLIKDISTFGIKVEIYQKGKLTKTYYVGSDDSNSMGTYMILEGSKSPFVMHIPGFLGFLSIRYTPLIAEWRERVIFRYSPNEIKQIKVNYPENQDNSFIIDYNNNKDFNIATINGKKVNFEIDTLKMKEYLAMIKFVGFEAYIDENLQKQKIDSLISQPILVQFDITDKNGITNTLKTYRRQNITQQYDDQGNPYEWDIDNLYGIINNDTEAVILQYYIIDPISFILSDFRKN